MLGEKSWEEALYFPLVSQFLISSGHCDRVTEGKSDMLLRPLWNNLQPTLRLKTLVSPNSFRDLIKGIIYL